MRDPRPPQGAQSALRALHLLQLFTAARPEMTLSELAAAAGAVAAAESLRFADSDSGRNPSMNRTSDHCVVMT